MIAIIDYQAGNLFSVQNALNYLGIENEITADPNRLTAADGLILPGVGAFPQAKQSLDDRGLTELIRKLTQTKPLLGICLGFQLLFDESTEFSRTEGLHLIPGVVDSLSDCDGALKIPHIGWNQLKLHRPCDILRQAKDGDSVYFVHSYRAFTDETYLAATCQYGGEVPAAVQYGNVYGCQFHPEKSGELGLSILKEFAKKALGA